MVHEKLSPAGQKLAKAILTKLSCSPRKVNLVLGLIRGQPVSAALKQLRFSTKRVANDVHGLLFSAISNAENNYDMDVDRLVVNEAYVGKNMQLKRMHARARGRGSRITKVFSNVTIILTEKELN